VKHEHCLGELKRKSEGVYKCRKCGEIVEIGVYIRQQKNLVEEIIHQRRFQEEIPRWEPPSTKLADPVEVINPLNKLSLMKLNPSKEEVMKHENCGGELTKPIGQTKGLYTCQTCGEQIFVGKYQERGGWPGQRQWRHYISIPISEDPMKLRSVITSGKKILIVGGGMQHQRWVPYKQHPQLVFWSGSSSDIEKHLKGANNFPVNTGGVIMSRGVTHVIARKISDEQRRKKIFFHAVNTEGTIMNILNNALEQKKEEQAQKLPQLTTGDTSSETYATTTQEGKPRLKPGELVRFITKHHQSELSYAAEGARLFTIAQTLGLPTTLHSMQQTVRTFRQKAGVVGPRGGTWAKKEQGEPKKTKRVEIKTGESTKAASPQVESMLRVIDDAMTALTLVREEVIRMQSDRDELESLKSKLAALIGR
jgi:peptide methionine sulfoxide reductase MsrB